MNQTNNLTMKNCAINQLQQDHSNREENSYNTDNCSCPQQIQKECRVNPDIVDKKALEFTTGMIREQEELVTSMSRQDIPEVLIKRQFERLLEEQKKQLSSLGDVNSTKKKESAEMEKTGGAIRNLKDETTRINKSCTDFLRSTNSSVRITGNREKSLKNNELMNRQHLQQQQQQQHQYQLQQQLQHRQRSNNHHHHHQHHQHQSDTNESVKSEKKNNKICANDLQHQQQPQHQQSQHQEHQENSTPSSGESNLLKLEPSSLLKIRLEKEARDRQARNNGLQEASAAQEIMKKFVNCPRNFQPISGKRSGLPFESSPSHYQSQPQQKQQQDQTRVSDPTIREATETTWRQSSNEQLFTPTAAAAGDWMRRRTSEIAPPGVCAHPHPHMHPQHDSMSASRTGQLQHTGLPPSQTKHNEIIHKSHDETHLSTGEALSQQPTMLYSTPETTGAATVLTGLNSYVPDLQEPKIIGGFTYLARKPRYIPNNPAADVDPQ